MDESTKNKMMAAGKMAFGLSRMASGIATAGGVGLIGAFLNAHHMKGAAMRLGVLSWQAGMKDLEKGWSEFKES